MQAGGGGGGGGGIICTERQVLFNKNENDTSSLSPEAVGGVDSQFQH